MCQILPKNLFPIFLLIFPIHDTMFREAPWGYAVSQALEKHRPYGHKYHEVTCI